MVRTRRREVQIARGDIHEPDVRDRSWKGIARWIVGVCDSNDDVAIEHPTRLRMRVEGSGTFASVLTEHTVLAPRDDVVAKDKSCQLVPGVIDGDRGVGRRGI